MISRIDGILEAIEGERALVRLGGGLTLEVLLPAFAASRLGGLGQPVTLHTLTFFESHNQGATMLPRLAGFPSPQDRAFFELFTTCKGIGMRRALRAMALSPGQIAAAIADRDLATLQSLPEVGKRTAETIAVTLKGKVDRFVSEAAYPRDAAAGSGPGPDPPRTPIAREALEVLLQLGEKRTDAMLWIDQALTDEQPPRDAQALVTAVYRLKAGG